MVISKPYIHNSHTNMATSLLPCGSKDAVLFDVFTARVLGRVGSVRRVMDVSHSTLQGACKVDVEEWPVKAMDHYLLAKSASVVGVIIGGFAVVTSLLKAAAATRSLRIDGIKLSLTCGVDRSRFFNITLPSVLMFVDVVLSVGSSAC